MLIDLIIVAALIYSVARNWHSGFLRQFWAAFGFFGGLIVGRWMTNLTLTITHNPADRALITIITMFGMAIFGLSIGEYVGIKLKYKWLNSKINPVDNVLGSLFTLVAVLLSIWLIASVITRVPSPTVKTEINRSKIIAALNNILPPAPTLISELSHLIDPNGFPDVFVGNEPIPRGNISLPLLGDFQTAVNADRYSVDRIQGLGCGGIVSGSGFVVAPGLVATNAHVVAGIANPYVEDVNGRHRAEVILFDPELDFAVLKTNNLAGAPLSIDSADQSPGTQGVVLGYPGGGSFSAGPSAILDEFNASGRDIYGSGLTVRAVYELQADIIPGNSGGPLIEKNGAVMGVVFAKSTTYQNVGYALAMAKVNSEVHQAEGSTTAVSTGQCAAQ